MTEFAYDNPVKTVNDCIFFILSLKVDFPALSRDNIRTQNARKKRTLPISTFAQTLNTTRTFFLALNVHQGLRRYQFGGILFKVITAAADKRFLLLFHLRQRRKTRRKYLERYWVRDNFQNRFPVGEYHTVVEEKRENDHE